MALQLLVRRLNAFKSRFLAALTFPPGIDGVDPATLLLDVQTDRRPSNGALGPSSSVLKDIIGDGLLWAVQRNRRSVERRLKRKNATVKHMRPKKNLVMCNVCGHFNEIHTLCGNCYNKVRQETNLMQEAIQNELKLDPVDKEVVVLYDKEHKGDEQFWEGKRIVEMKKERPDWFHQNLAIKTRNPDASTENSLQLNTKSIIAHVK